MSSSAVLHFLLASIVTCGGQIQGDVTQGLGGVVQQSIGGVAQGVGGVADGIGGVVQGVGGAAAQGIFGVAQGVEGVTQAVGGITRDVAEGYAGATNKIFALGVRPVLSQCANLKDLLGLSYSRIINSRKEPRMDELTLEYISRERNMTFNVTSVAKDILESGYPYYNTSQKLYIFIHGWSVDPYGEAFQQIKDSFYDQGRNNVLALDSSKYIKWFYLRASTYVVFIGQKLAELLAGLNEAGLPRDDIHIIGHSLGAQISGYAGKTFQNLTGTKIGRITGLDPAGPCFTEMNDNYRLKSTDADFVDIIHSNSGLMGIERDGGHQDFYPNGGFQQPGCLTMSCSHGRAVSLFAESIKDPRAFPAVKCDSWDSFKRGKCADGDIVYMGFGAEPSSPNGTYFLQTEGSSPYSLGGIGMKYENPLRLL